MGLACLMTPIRRKPRPKRIKRTTTTTGKLRKGLISPWQRRTAVRQFARRTPPTGAHRRPQGRLQPRRMCARCSRTARASRCSTSAAPTGATRLTLGLPTSKRTTSKSAWRRTACSRWSPARTRPGAASSTRRASAMPTTRRRCGAPTAAAQPTATTAEPTGASRRWAPRPRRTRAGRRGPSRTGAALRTRAPRRVRA